MSFIEKQNRKRGDRRDGIWIKDAPGINIIMASLFPNRCDCEVSIKKEIDITKLLKYIEDKNNSGQTHETKLFHCIITMMVRIFNTRRLLNRFVQGGRIYERDFISAAFVAKRQFNDKAEEALLTYKAKGKDNVDDVSKFILGEVDIVKHDKDRVGKKGKSINGVIDNLGHKPTWFLRSLIKFVRWLDTFGKAPKAFTSGDPNFATLLITNLGSIKCPAVYHHLNNYGTNSVLLAIGMMEKKNVLNADGTITTKDVVELQFTADERIADGFYFAKSLKIIDAICENPSILEKPFEEDVEFELK